VGSFLRANFAVRNEAVFFLLREWNGRGVGDSATGTFTLVGIVGRERRDGSIAYGIFRVGHMLWSMGLGKEVSMHDLLRIRSF
jgi:hypothetical protein